MIVFQKRGTPTYTQYVTILIVGKPKKVNPRPPNFLNNHMVSTYWALQDLLHPPYPMGPGTQELGFGDLETNCREHRKSTYTP